MTKPILRFQLTLNWSREEEEKYIKYIKARIKEAREESHMTQGELADKLGRTQAYFSKLEGSTLVPSIVEVLGIAQFTGKPIQFFLPIQDAREDFLTGEEWQLIAHFRNIEDEAIRDIALGTLKKMAEAKKTKGKK